jgi:hypothetical protein
MHAETMNEKALEWLNPTVAMTGGDDDAAMRIQWIRRHWNDWCQ